MIRHFLRDDDLTSSEQTAVHPGGLSADSSHSDWYAPLFTDFLRQVRDKAPAREDVQEAVYVARVIECAYASSDTDRVVAKEYGVRPIPQTMFVDRDGTLTVRVNAPLTLLSKSELDAELAKILAPATSTTTPTTPPR